MRKRFSIDELRFAIEPSTTTPEFRASLCRRCFSVRSMICVSGHGLAPSPPTLSPKTSNQRRSWGRGRRYLGTHTQGGVRSSYSARLHRRKPVFNALGARVPPSRRLGPLECAGTTALCQARRVALGKAATRRRTPNVQTPGRAEFLLRTPPRATVCRPLQGSVTKQRPAAAAHWKLSEPTVFLI